MNDPREALVVAYLEQRDSAEPISLNAFIQKHPKIEGLREAIQAALDAEALFPRSAPTEDRLGNYQIIRQIGRGGTSKVFLVHPLPEPKTVLALKLLDLPARFNRRAVERFRREVGALVSLNHPNVVRVVDHDVNSESPYLVMEHVAGPTLAELPARTATPENQERERRVQIVASLARGLQAVHERGLLHRDLKPSNVVLREGGEPVLVDFGMVGMEQAHTLTETGDVLGTPHYMAPEQALGGPTDPRTDVFGLGAILWELITGERPHSGETPWAAMESARRRPVPPLRSKIRSVPPPLELITHRATMYDAEGRYPTAAAMADDLEAYLRGEPVRARPVSTRERWKSWRRRSPAALPMLGVIAGLLLVVPLLWAVRRDGSPAMTNEEQRLWKQAINAAACALLDERPTDVTTHLQSAVTLDDDADAVRWLVGRDASLCPNFEHPGYERLWKGWQHLKKDRVDLAVPLFEQGSQQLPDVGLAVGLLATALGENPRTDRAFRELQGARRMLPDCATIAWRLGQAFHWRDEYSEALPHLEFARKHLPLRWEVARSLATTLYRLDRPAQSLREAEAAVELVSEQEADQVVDTMLNTYASILDKQGQWQEAERLFRQILERRPEHLSARLNLGLNLDAQHRMAEAEEAYRAVLDQDPDDLKARGCLAYLHSGSRRNECQDCAQFFEEHPELLDEELALEHALAILEIDRGRDLSSLMTAVTSATQAGFPEEMAVAIDEQLRDEEDDRRVVNLQKALRWLQRQ